MYTEEIEGKENVGGYLYCISNKMYSLYGKMFTS